MNIERKFITISMACYPEGYTGACEFKSRKVEMIKAYMYNSCSQCRDVGKALNQAGIDFEAREFFMEKFTREELTELLATTGLSLDDIVSKRSNPYREMALANRKITDDELIGLMLEEPRLIRRPIVVGTDGVLIGSKAADVQAFIEKEVSR